MSRSRIPRRSGSMSRWGSRAPGPTSCTGAASRDRLDPEHLVQFLRGKPVVARGDGAEHLGDKLDLVERHAVVDARIETLTHRAHLHCRADPQQAVIPGYARPGAPA